MLQPTSFFNPKLLAFIAISSLFLVSGQAFGQEEENEIDEDKRRLGIITVTAEKMSENIQDVGQSIQAFDAEGLEKGGVTDISRLELLVSGVNYAYVGNDAKINVRGANSSNTFGDVTSIAGTFVDGIYQPRASQQTRAFFDVERLEFLKGPQGTLYGRNTFAAAVNLFTRKPEFDIINGAAEFNLSRFNRVQAEAFANIGISDNFAIRIAGFGEYSDGYISNDAGPTMGAPEDGGMRISALWEVNENIEILARYQFVLERGREAGLFGYTFLCRNVNGQGLTDPLGTSQDCANPNPGSGGLPSADTLGPYQISQDFVPNIDMQQHNFTMEANIDLGPVTVKSLTAYIDYGNLIGFDGDFSASEYSRYWFDEKADTFSQELQFSSDYESPLQWNSGLYYSYDQTYYSFLLYNHASLDGSRSNVVGPGGASFDILTGLPIVEGTTLLQGHYADSTFIDIQTFGIYGQAEYSIMDNLRVIAGLRYSLEDKRLDGGGSNFTGDTNGDTAVDSPVTVNPDYAAGTSPSVLPLNPYDVFTINRYATDAAVLGKTFNNVSWKAGLEYDVIENVLLYFNASSGFLSGAVNRNGTITDEQESRVYEIGFKSQLFDYRLLLNAGFHYTEYINLLRQVQEMQGGIAITSSDNGGKINALGIEVEAVFIPIEPLTITANLAYLNSKYGNFGQNNPYQLYNGAVQSFIDVTGEVTPWSPEFTIGLSAAYEIDLGDYGYITPYIQFYFSTEYYTSNLLGPDPNQLQAGFTKTDLRLTWTDVNNKYMVEVFAENLEDSAVLARGNNNSSDLVQTGYLYPRNYGVRLRAKF